MADLARRWRTDSKLRAASDELGGALERMRLAIVQRATAEELAAPYREVRQAAAQCAEALEQRAVP